MGWDGMDYGWDDTWDDFWGTRGYTSLLDLVSNFIGVQMFVHGFSLALRRLAAKYSMPARMWKHGIH